MELKEFIKTYSQIFEAIGDSITGKKLTSALILLYTAMESFSGLLSKGNVNEKQLFMDWVRKWMLLKYPLPCNEKDLYSEKLRFLSQPGFKEVEGAREIFYVSGKANIQFLQNLVERTGKSDRAVSVRVEDILNSFRKGVEDHLKEIENDETLKKCFDKKVWPFYVRDIHEQERTEDSVI